MNSHALKEALGKLEQRFLQRKVSAAAYEVERARLEGQLAALPMFPSLGESERPAASFTLEQLPYPLALTFRRLEAEMERQEPIAAAWALRDAFEVAIKFAACAALADLLQSNPTAASGGEVLKLLFPRGGKGLAIGDWERLLGATLVAEQPLRQLAGLRPLFVKGNDFNELKKALGSSEKNFVNWRNRVFGHGVFAEDRRFYADQTLEWRPRLLQLLEGLVAALPGWQLVDTQAGSPWMGVDTAPIAGPHAFAATGPLIPLALAVPAGGTRIDFGPLTTLQRCQVCGSAHVFFFDGHQRENRKKPAIPGATDEARVERHKSFFLDYLAGHSNAQKDLPQVMALMAKLPKNFQWERDAFDQQEVAEEDALVFRDFASEYHRPGYLFAAAQAVLGRRTRGYLHLTGPEGSGKTWFVRGLAEEANDTGAALLAYHIRAGERADYTTFVTLLADAAAARFRKRTQEIATNVARLADLRAQFVEFTQTLIVENSLAALVVVIDGLDELPAPGPGGASIVDFLPAESALPDKCQVLLTSREQLPPHVSTALERLKSGGEFAALQLDPTSEANQSLVREYVAMHLEPPALVDAVVAGCQGVFLYAFHLTQALRQGVFTAGEALPVGRELYPEYLARLRQRVGDELYATVYLSTLLLLTAARAPVPLDQLVAWGLPRDRLRLALLNLRDFLREYRQVDWNDSLNNEGDYRYSLAHASFREFVQTDPELSTRLKATHQAIATQSLNHFQQIGWDKADPYDEIDLYALLHFARHCQIGGVDPRQVLDAYHASCLTAGTAAGLRKRYRLVAAICGNAIAGLRWQLEREAGNYGLAYEARSLMLTGALVDNATAQQALGREAEAITLYDETLGVLRSLEDRVASSVVARIFASSKSNKANVLWKLGRVREALDCSTEAVGTLQRLVEAGHAECGDLLGLALSTKGNALAALERTDEALSYYAEAGRVLHSLPETRRDEVTTRLATVVMNQGVCFFRLDQPAKAVERYDEAIRLLSPLCDHQYSETQDDMAAVLTNKALALMQLENWREAHGFFKQAIETQKLLIQVGREELTIDLANTVATALLLPAQPNAPSSPDAIPFLDEMIGFLRPLVKGHRELTVGLSKALTHKGWALDKLGQFGEAVLAYDQAIGYLQSPPGGGRQDAHPQTQEGLATALEFKAASLGKLGAVSDALQSTESAIDLLRSLVGSGRGELADSLQRCVGQRGIWLYRLGREIEAFEAFEDEIRAAPQVTLQADEWRHWQELAKLISHRALGWYRKGRLREAEEAYKRAIAIQQELLQRGDERLWLDLGITLSLLEELLKKEGRQTEAEACRQRQIKIVEESAEADVRKSVHPTKEGATVANVRVFEIIILAKDKMEKLKSLDAAIAYLQSSESQSAKDDKPLPMELKLFVVAQLVLLRFKEKRAALLRILHEFAQDIDNAAKKYRGNRWVPKESLDDIKSGKSLRRAKVVMAIGMLAFVGVLVGISALLWGLMTSFSSTKLYMFIAAAGVATFAFVLSRMLKKGDDDFWD